MFLKTTVAFLSLSCLSAVALVGCGAEDPIPQMPTYAADVRPIVIGHCVRCHGAGDKVNKDPFTTGGSGTGAPTNGYFQYFENRDCPGTMCKRGLIAYATEPAFKMLMNAYLHPVNENDRMPPPPAPALSDREMAIMDRWLANPLP